MFNEYLCTLNLVAVDYNRCFLSLVTHDDKFMSLVNTDLYAYIRYIGIKNDSHMNLFILSFRIPR